ncbi:MAG TPA: hypothetical protein VFL55_00995 [Acetobacteraceae bacterium]|nr:hypothetical protein [Acetobacteraceae bacterium]
MNQSFLDPLVEMLARTVPAGALQGKDARALARTLLEAWRPADAMEASMAARAIAAFFAAMDGFARAARPGLDDASVVRLRGNAVAAGRQFDGLLRTIRRQTHPQPRKAVSATKSRPAAEYQPPVPDWLPSVVRPAPAASLRDSTALMAPGPTVLVPS